MRILVDADACPVKTEILTEAKEKLIEVIFIASIAHCLESCCQQGARLIQVDNRAQEADIKLANEVQKGDLVITSDYGLAAIVLAKGAGILTPRGMRISEDNIESLLQQRFLASKARRSGNKTKGPQAFSLADRNRFCAELQKILRLSQKKELADV